MFTGLRVTGTLSEKAKENRVFAFTFDAVTLLSYLQQVWPGVSPAPGTGSRDAPWQPTSLKQWFYCAKLKGSGSTAKRFPSQTDKKAWVLTGGRYIAIDPASLYSSDYGTTGTTETMKAPTYPNLNEMLETWRKANRAVNTDKVLTRQIRARLAGKPVVGGPECLSVLTTVFFVSEVARNHTAFHTTLMAMDLIEMGAVLDPTGANVPWTWSNAIWRNTACGTCAGTKHTPCGTCGGTGDSLVTAQCGSCAGAGRIRASLNCGTCAGHGGWNCGACRGSGWTSTRGLGCGACGGGRGRRGAGGVTCHACGGRRTFTRDVDCSNCGRRGRITLPCGTCKGHRKVTCATCDGVGMYDEYRPKGSTSAQVKGDVAVLQNGLLPMSHKASALGAAFDLTGDGTYNLVKGGTKDISAVSSPLLVVRRKEATIMIHWLKLVLDGVKLEFSKTQTLELAATEMSVDMDLTTRNFSKSYEEIEKVALEGGSLIDDTDEDLGTEVYKSIRSKIVSYIETRCENSSYGLELNLYEPTR
ncbi:MAG: hypothetical protein RJA70_2024 [Pseudomonadota bacterium]|jgi:hypothetical protein